MPPIEQNGALLNADATARALISAGSASVVPINGAMSADDSLTRALVSLGSTVGIEHQGAVLNADAVQRLLAAGGSSKPVTYAAGIAIPAPGGISSFSLVGSWDFNASNTTLTGNRITNITGSDGTSFALANASTGPTQALIADGGNRLRNAAIFVSANSTYLQIANSLGLTSAGCTVVMVAIMTTAGGNSSGVSGSLLDIAVGSGAASINRNVMYQSAGAPGINFRKIDSTSTSSTAQQGVAYSNVGTHLLVGRSPATTLGAILNIGTGGDIGAAATNSAPSGFTYTTMGATMVSSATTSYSDIQVFRALVYNGPITDAEVAGIVSWAQFNYGIVAQ